MPIERAVPSMIRDGGLEVVGVEVGHLDLGDLAHLRPASPADLLAAGRREPFSTPAALRSRSAAGGVLRMKVKLRSS